MNISFSKADAGKTLAKLDKLLSENYDYQSWLDERDYEAEYEAHIAAGLKSLILEQFPDGYFK